MDKQEIREKVRLAIENEPQKQSIKRVSLFGSYINSSPRADSDVDLLIEFVPNSKIGFFKYIGIQENIKQYLNKEVDLLTPEALSKYFKQDVLKQAEIIYER